MIRFILQYLKHRIKSGKWNAFHSPYLFDLFTYACDEKIVYPVFNTLEEKRRLFYRSEVKIKRSDYGAGSQSLMNNSIGTVASIAKSALSNPFQCRFMSRLARWTSPKNMLELGTSFGISSAYIASGAHTGTLTTFEGDPAIAEMAGNLFEELGLRNIKLVQKTFEQFFAEASGSNEIDLLFIDGNHKQESLLKYYHGLKPFLKPESIVIVDDIYWSSGMHAAWQELITYPEITQSVDCFRFGILFFDSHFLQKQNHLVYLPLSSVLPN